MAMAALSNASAAAIVPVDLLAFATNASYLTGLVPIATTNKTNAENIVLLSYHADFDSAIGEHARARKLYDFDWEAFHEAGVYSKETGQLYVTSNWAGSLDNPINVTIIDVKNDYAISSTRYRGLAEPNGATSWYPPGTNNSSHAHVLYCDEGDFISPSALISIDPVTNTTTPLLTNFLGRNFSSLNDARQHPQTGDIWFTDADYGYFQHFRPAPTIPKQVYRFSPTTGEIAVVADGFTQPNGLDFSPDLMTLYVTDTGAAGFEKNGTRPATIYAFDIVSTGTKQVLRNRRVFAYVDTGFPDGIHTDMEGNVWAACGDGIHIWNREGALLGKIWIGVESNNFAFLPGKVLVFSNKQLWVVEDVLAVGREIGKDFGM